MNQAKVIAICFGLVFIGLIVGYTFGVITTQKVYRYYTVSGYVTFALPSTGFVFVPKPNASIMLFYENDPIIILYTDSQGFYYYSFLGIEGATLKIIPAAPERYFAPALVEIRLGKNNHIMQNFKIWP